MLLALCTGVVPQFFGAVESGSKPLAWSCAFRTARVLEKLPLNEARTAAVIWSPPPIVDGWQLLHMFWDATAVIVPVASLVTDLKVCWALGALMWQPTHGPSVPVLTVWLGVPMPACQVFCLL